MKHLLAVIAGFALPSPAAADCLPPFEGWLQLQGEVAACREVKAPQPSSESFLRLEVDAPTVSINGCDGRECPGLPYYANYAESLEGGKLFFIRTRGEVSCSTIQEAQSLVARVTYQCCDTIPHRGVCALGGPVIELVADEL